MEWLCATYRGPLLAFARSIEPDPARADDLLQGFFASLLERPDAFASVSKDRGRFRAFLRTAFHNHARNARKKDLAWKAGGRAAHVDVDTHEVECDAPLSDRLYDRTWGQTLLDRALARLAEEQTRAGKGALFEALRERLTDEDGAALREVGERFGMKENAVKQSLHRLRIRYGAILRAEIAETVARPEDVEAELAHLREAWREDVRS
jgi:RNA polymerase sigma-70 factor (ECF subfamily)